MQEVVKKKVRNTVDKLRQKPEKERRDILHLFMIIGSFLLVVLYVVSLGSSISGADQPKEVKEKKQKKGLEVFSVLKDNISGGVQSITANNSENIE